jgi:CSLREA domain-containing protein
VNICSSLLLVLFVGVAPAFAQAFYVNSTRDEIDPTPGDGLCWTGSLLPDPPHLQECTLRAALMEANNPTPGRRPTYRIILPAGTFPIELSAVDVEVEEYRQLAGIMSTEVASQSNDFDLRSDVWITGAGVGVTIIDGAGRDRLFDIIGLDDSANTVFEQMTLRGGRTRGPGGCVRNLATGGIVYLNNVAIEGCVSDEGRGGGMINHGGVIMTRVQFRDNEAHFGGGLENLSVAQIYESVFHHNAGQISISTPTRGGAISNLAGASLTLWNSTISRNRAVLGGGVLNQGSMSILNSTISTNSGRGGGIAFVGPSAEGASLSIVSSTITNNTDLGIYRSSTAPLELRGAIVAGNRNHVGAAENCEGGITSSRESLEDVNTCGLTGMGDIVNTDPLLGPLADNGGPTQTHALLASSPAIDAAPSRYERRDQRDFPRPMFGASDIGAYEKGFEFIAVIPFEWTYLYRDVFTRADTSFRVTLSLRTAGTGSDIADARIIGVKGANGPVKIERAKDGQSYDVSGVFTPPKDQGNATLFYLEVLPGAKKASQLRISDIACDCDATPRKHPPTIVISSAEQFAKQQ